MRLFSLLFVSATVLWAQVTPQDLFQLTTTDFPAGGSIPPRFTCDDMNASPTLNVTGVPAAAKTLVLIVDDPDAPQGTFTHWLVWNIPPGTKEIVAHTAPASSVQGKNDFRNIGYNGPCPPAGSEHRYYFRLFALDRVLTLPRGTTRAELDKAMEKHVVAQTVLMGRYARGGTR